MNSVPHRVTYPNLYIISHTCFKSKLRDDYHRYLEIVLTDAPDYIFQYYSTIVLQVGYAGQLIQVLLVSGYRNR